MFKFVTVGGAACALLSAAVVAQTDDSAHGKWGMRGQTQTRADVETRVKQQFAALDANRDNVVTAEERTAYREGKRKAMKDRHFAALDSNNDGSISRAEFDAGHAGRSGMRGGKRMHGGRGGGDGAKGFARGDVNGDGKMTQSEMTARALERFDRIDTNKDGTLSPEERRAGWGAMRGERGKHGGGAETL